MSGITRTVKEILEFNGEFRGDIYDIEPALNAINDTLFNGSYLDIDFEADISRIDIEYKYEINYDGRRGAACIVLYLDKTPSAIYMGAGRELDDRTACYILNKEKCSEIIELIRDKIFEVEVENIGLNEEVELLYWEGTPVDLGEFGFKKPL